MGTDRVDSSLFLGLRNGVSLSLLPSEKPLFLGRSTYGLAFFGGIVRGKQFFELSAVLVMFAVILLTGSAQATGGETLLHSFGNGGDGAYPSGLVFDAAGNLYGTAATGGAYNWGTVFELSPQAGGGWTETILHNFNNNGDGLAPSVGLIFDAAGNLYGTTDAGGLYQNGTVFELEPGANGIWTEKILHDFNPNGKDGLAPQAGLVMDAAGNLYGTTYAGGRWNGGTAFELLPGADGTWTEQILHPFAYADGIDGTGPYPSLVFDAAGNLYGTTNGGGVYGSGTVFELTHGTGGAWFEKVIHSFNPNGKDGTFPFLAGVVFDTAGNLYGVTFEGGTGTCSGGCGTVFELTRTPGGSWVEKTLHNFSNNGKDGVNPVAALILGASGRLYGTTAYGGTGGCTSEGPGCGTVFELAPKSGGGWVESFIYSFQNNGADGVYPGAGVILDAAGNVYGTTSEGGAYGLGTVFEIIP
jgi:uncharacterized repeat protein (TIGR03803 family)